MTFYRIGLSERKCLILATAFVLTIKLLIVSSQCTSSDRKIAINRSMQLSAAANLSHCYCSQVQNQADHLPLCHSLSLASSMQCIDIVTICINHMWEQSILQITLQNQLKAEDKSGNNSACAERSSSFKEGERWKEAMICPRTDTPLWPPFLSHTWPPPKPLWLLPVFHESLKCLELALRAHLTDNYIRTKWAFILKLQWTCKCILPSVSSWD